MPGKLPQKKLVREAARGYSSYGNQIGLATGYVKEIYHPNYAAKRMEIGAVMGAAPRRAVRRLSSDPGDVIILLGGRTGCDRFLQEAHGCLHVCLRGGSPEGKCPDRAQAAEAVQAGRGCAPD